MKPISILMRATATAALTGAAVSLTGAAALAQDGEPDETMTVEGQANTPRSSEFVQDNDLLRAAAEAWDNSDLDRAPYTDDHAWVGHQVQGEAGGRLGEIERVRLSETGEVEAIVVEAGGWMDIGGREVLIPRDEVSFTEDSETAIIAHTRVEFEALPRFNEDAASEFPLSDRDYGDNENEQELDDTPSGS
ncbi:MAG: PRC-barrel domain-containing protein [Alphaproteobacteria bacterium]|uniref:PRC-barrel domain-containing protein n=1 Tax=Maricaulis alexandrii TaxID=2570354 RepID=UPI001108A22B|nr:PRC-barrel domain-containing protein [Maricaulis alexandrii]MCR9266975.1 PRC-barrel domain-containing protein [Alphaproteobacteria bacterium]